MTCQPRPRAESDLQVDYKSILEKTVDSRSRASVTVESKQSLTSEGYIQIGTIRATEPGAKVDPAVTENLRDFILREAAKNGGDVVVFRKEGVIGWRRTEKTVQVCEPLALLWMWLEGALGGGGEPCPDSTTDYIGGFTKKRKAIVSEGTVWRRDPELTAYFARMPERDHFFSLIRDGNKLTSIEEALVHNPGLAMIRDKDGETALHYAAAGDEADLVKLLLTYHADVNALDNRRWTPMDEAGWADAKEVIRILRENGGYF